jgi:hypothetical protein
MLLAIVGQVVDFFWKAAVAYAATPAGAKELNDIAVAAGLQPDGTEPDATPVVTRANRR